MIKTLYQTLTILLIFFVSTLEAQITKKSANGEVYCKNKDYMFLLDGNYYLDNSKVYICPKKVPINLTVVDTSSPIPLPIIYPVSWTINGNVSPITNSTVSIDSSHFNSDQSDIVAEFMDVSAGNTVVLNLKINKDIQLSFSQSARNYQFDDNNIQAYITHIGYGEPIGVPWNFIEEGQLDTLEAKASKKKGYYAINDISSTSNDLNAVPSSLSHSPEDIAFSFSGTGHSIVEIHGCHDSVPELLLYTANDKSYPVNFYYMCDTDDDVPRYCNSDRTLQSDCMTPITSPDYVCISGGVDRSIDEMYKRNSNGILEILAQGDLLQLNGGIYNVLAGPDLTCNHTAHPNNPPDCSDNFDITDAMKTANDILNKIAIDVSISSIDTLMLNYNLINEDNKLELEEQRELHRWRHGNFPSNAVEVYIVNDLDFSASGNKVLGRATERRFLTMTLDAKDATKHTLVHELGHAIWGLLHPGRPYTYDTAGNIIDQGQFGVDDFENFMHGISNQVVKWKIRRYQFDEMH